MINATRVNKSQGRAVRLGKVGMREISYIIQSTSRVSVKEFDNQRFRTWSHRLSQYQIMRRLCNRNSAPRLAGRGLKGRDTAGLAGAVEELTYQANTPIKRTAP